jgi:hypothetical protein
VRVERPEIGFHGGRAFDQLAFMRRLLLLLSEPLKIRLEPG